MKYDIFIGPHCGQCPFFRVIGREIQNEQGEIRLAHEERCRLGWGEQYFANGNVMIIEVRPGELCPGRGYYNLERIPEKGGGDA